MKSPERISAAGFVVVVALVIAGCGHQDGDSHAQELGEVEAGVTFHARKGLRVPPETAKFIGLQVADAEQRKIVAAFQFAAQVYRAASEAQLASWQSGGTPTALASGNVSPVDAAKLNDGQMVSVQSADGGISLAGRMVTLKRGLEKASGQVEVLLAIGENSRWRRR